MIQYKSMNYTKLIKLLPKNIQEKYDDRVLNKAMDLTEYDLAKNNKSSEDISEKNYEIMIVKNIEKVIQGQNDRVSNTLQSITGLALLKSVWKKSIGGDFSDDDDDEEV